MTLWYNALMNPIVKRIVSALTTAALFVVAIIYVPTAWILPAVIALVLVAALEYVLLL